MDVQQCACLTDVPFGREHCTLMDSQFICQEDFLFPVGQKPSFGHSLPQENLLAKTC